MKCREFILAKEPDFQITEQKYAAFYLQFQKAILASLKTRELLTCSQYDRCIEELEKQYKGFHNEV